MLPFKKGFFFFFREGGFVSLKPVIPVAVDYEIRKNGRVGSEFTWVSALDSILLMMTQFSNSATVRIFLPIHYEPSKNETTLNGQAQEFADQTQVFFSMVTRMPIVDGGFRESKTYLRMEKARFGL